MGFHVFAWSARAVVIGSLIWPLLSFAAADSSVAGESFFEQKIRPVLAEHCYECHSAKRNKFKGGLALDSKERVLKGGDTGPALVPSKPEESLLLKAMRHADPELEMPPDEKLPSEVVANFEKWIKAGAPFPVSASDALAEQPWWDKLQPLRPADEPIAKVVDGYVNARLAEVEVSAAPPASDANFIRRATLDLVGRIPTELEVRDYVASTDPDRKARLIDRLLASPGFVRHQVTELEWMLMDGKGGAFREYLVRAVKENRGWDDLFREVMTADATNAPTKGAEQFLKTRVTDQDRLANDVSVRFFGVNISCAQCHDHPQVLSWKQDHYYGMKSFFSRTFENGEHLGERDYGYVSFKPKRGDTKRAALMFLSGDVLTEPEAKEPSGEEKKAEKAKLEEAKKNKVPPPAPKFSRRAQLVETALKQGENGYFARAIVNQLWARFFGQGLVMPVDQMHAQNTPSHPELLAWLARDLVKRDYDLRALIRGMVLSDAYARSSEWSGPRPDARLYAVAVPRPLTPRQMATSLQLATARTASLTNRAEFESAMERVEKEGNAWVSSFERPSFDFQVSVEEALMLSNNQKANEELLSNHRIVRDLLGVNKTDDVIQTAFRQVMLRTPDPAEARAFRDYIEQRSDRPTEAVRQVVWALISSSEFRFNY